MPRAALAAHTPRGNRPVRSRRLRTDASRPGRAARLRTHPSRLCRHSWRDLWDRLASVRDALAAVSLWTTAAAGRVVWRAGVSLRVGADRADDVQRLPGDSSPPCLAEYEPGGRAG